MTFETDVNVGLILSADSSLRQFEIYKRYPDGHPELAIHASIELPLVVWVERALFRPMQCRVISHKGWRIYDAGLPDELHGRGFVTCECVGRLIE